MREIIPDIQPPPVATFVLVLVVAIVLVLSAVDGWLSVFPVCSTYAGTVRAYLPRRRTWPGCGSPYSAT